MYGQRLLKAVIVGIGFLPLSGCITSVYLIESALNKTENAVDLAAGFPEQEAARLKGLPLTTLSTNTLDSTSSNGLSDDLFRKWRDYELGRRYETGEDGATQNLSCAYHFYNRSRVSAGNWSDNQNGFDFIWAKKAVDRLTQDGVPQGDHTCERLLKDDAARS